MVIAPHEAGFEKTDPDKHTGYFAQCLGNPHHKTLWMLKAYNGSERDCSNSQHRNPVFGEHGLY